MPCSLADFPPSWLCDSNQRPFGYNAKLPAAMNWTEQLYFPQSELVFKWVFLCISLQSPVRMVSAQTWGSYSTSCQTSTTASYSTSVSSSPRWTSATGRTSWPLSIWQLSSAPMSSSKFCSPSLGLVLVGQWVSGITHLGCHVGPMSSSVFYYMFMGFGDGC